MYLKQELKNQQLYTNKNKNHVQKKKGLFFPKKKLWQRKNKSKKDILCIKRRDKIMILDLRNENTEVYVYDFEDNVEITIIDHETAEKCLIKMPNKIVEIFKKYLQNEAESI